MFSAALRSVCWVCPHCWHRNRSRETRLAVSQCPHAAQVREVLAGLTTQVLRPASSALTHTQCRNLPNAASCRTDEWPPRSPQGPSATTSPMTPTAAAGGRVLADETWPATRPRLAPNTSDARGGPERRPSRLLGDRPRRQPGRPTGHDPGRTRRAHRPAGRATPPGTHRPCRPRRRARVRFGDGREPELHRRPRDRPGNNGPRHPRQTVPADSVGDPHRKVPDPARRHGPQPRSGRDRGRPGRYIEMGWRALAGPARHLPHPADSIFFRSDPVAPSCGSGRGRSTWTRAPGPATDTHSRRRPEDRQRATAVQAGPGPAHHTTRRPRPAGSASPFRWTRRSPR
jgi:hypothetical protein